MNVKQKQSFITVGLLYAAVAMISILFLNIARSEPAGAAAKSCEVLYSVAPVASQSDRDKASELMAACHEGYETNKCNNIKAGTDTTKKQRENACQKGRDYRKENPPDEPDNPGGGGSKCETAILPDSLCNSGGSVESNGVWGLLLIVINILTAGVAIVAIGGFVYGAILYTTAEANAGQITKAKETIFNVVLGLVAFAAMYAFLQFLIPGGIFN